MCDVNLRRKNLNKKKKEIMCGPIYGVCVCVDKRIFRIENKEKHNTHTHTHIEEYTRNSLESSVFLCCCCFGKIR